MALPNSQFTGFQPEGLWSGVKGLSYGTDTYIRRIQVGTFTLDPADQAANTSSENAVTVTGLTVDDLVLVAVQAFTASAPIIAGARVSAADTLQVQVANVSVAAINRPSQTYFFIAFRIR